MKTNLPLPWTAMRFLSNQLFIQGTFTLSLNNAVIKYHKAAHNIIWELPNATTDSHCQLLGAAWFTTTACCSLRANWKLSTSFKGATVASEAGSNSDLLLPVYFV